MSELVLNMPGSSLHANNIIEYGLAQDSVVKESLTAQTGTATDVEALKTDKAL